MLGARPDSEGSTPGKRTPKAGSAGSGTVGIAEGGTDRSRPRPPGLVTQPHMGDTALHRCQHPLWVSPQSVQRVREFNHLADVRDTVKSSHCSVTC